MTTSHPNHHGVQAARAFHAYAKRKCTTNVEICQRIGVSQGQYSRATNRTAHGVKVDQVADWLEKWNASIPPGEFRPLGLVWEQLAGWSVFELDDT